MDLTWEVVAGADKGGILVRTGRDTKSPEYPQRLAFGAVVRQIEMHGDRMNFQKISGDGPAIGWVSVRLKDKELLKLQVPATRAERDQSRKQLQQALQFSPHMKAQAQVYFTALDAADAEEDARGASRPAPAPAPVAKAPAAAAPVARKPAPKVAAAPPVATAPVARAPVAKAPASKPKVQDKAAGDPLAALREELESMKLKEIKAKAREAGFTEEDIEEAEEEERPKVALIDLILKKKAAEAPQQLPSMDELEAGMDDGDDEIIDAPAPAPARSAPVQSVPAEDDEYEDRIPSMTEVLAMVDDEEDPEPPSLEDVLKQLEKDEEEEKEFEESIAARQSFWNMGSFKDNSMVERLMLEDDNKSKRGVESLSALQNDSAPRTGVFNYNDIYAFGDLCVKRAMPEIEARKAAKEAEEARQEAGETPAKKPAETPAKKTAVAEDPGDDEDMDDEAFLASLGLAADGTALAK